MVALKAYPARISGLSRANHCWSIPSNRRARRQVSAGSSSPPMRNLLPMWRGNTAPKSSGVRRRSAATKLARNQPCCTRWTRCATRKATSQTWSSSCRPRHPCAALMISSALLPSCSVKRPTRSFQPRHSTASSGARRATPCNRSLMTIAAVSGDKMHRAITSKTARFMSLSPGYCADIITGWGVRSPYTKWTLCIHSRSTNQPICS